MYAKSIDPDQHALSAQADLKRNFLLLFNILHVQDGFLAEMNFLLIQPMTGFVWYTWNDVLNRILSAYGFGKISFIPVKNEAINVIRSVIEG